VTYFYPIATAVPNGTFDAYPFFVGETTSFDHIGINVGGAGGGGSKVDLGVYDDDGSLIPNARLAQVTNTTLVSGPLSVALSVTLTPGLYWLSAMFHSSGGTPAVNCDDGPGSSILGGNIPASSGSPTQTATGIHLTGQPTGLPSTFPFPGSPAYTSPTTIVNLQAV
jgi:hypothetical protein